MTISKSRNATGAAVIPAPRRARAFEGVAVPVVGGAKTVASMVVSSWGSKERQSRKPRIDTAAHFFSGTRPRPVLGAPAHAPEPSRPKPSGRQCDGHGRKARSADPLEVGTPEPFGQVPVTEDRVGKAGDPYHLVQLRGHCHVRHRGYRTCEPGVRPEPHLERGQVRVQLRFHVLLRVAAEALGPDVL